MRRTPLITRGLVIIYIAWIVAGMRAEEPVEGSLSWRTFRFESSGAGRSGAVTVSGSQTKSGISALRIEAFGKTFTLSAKELLQLHGLTVNSIRTSFYSEYPEYGGRHIRLWLGLAFASGVQRAKLVTVNERGRIHISDAAK